MAKADLNDIKTQIKSILDAANSTSATVDLSGGLTRRVGKVYKVHPAWVPMQADLYNTVTIWISRKDVESSTMAGTQARGLRKSEIEIKIAGFVFNPNVTDFTEDPADEDVNKLMENIEQIIRNSQTLNGTVNHTLPEKVEYYNDKFEEGNMRTGMLTLIAHVFH